jgi:hypothetical protein
MSRFPGLKKNTGLRCCSSNVVLMFPYRCLVVLTPNAPGGVYGHFGGTWCHSYQLEDSQCLPTYVPYHT